MVKAKVNEKEFEIDVLEDEFLVNGERVAWDLATIAENYFHIIYNNKSYRAEVVKIDSVTKTFVIKINGKRYTVELKSKFDLLLEKMGMQVGVSNTINAIKAPMPGLIISLKVQAGDVVKKNDPLLILEAMKMENIIKSPTDGTIKTVKIRQGESVEKSQVLIEF